MAKKEEPVIKIRKGVSKVRIHKASYTVIDEESGKVLLKVKK